MGMHGVVVLHPVIDESKSRSGIRDRTDPDIVALEGLYESLGHAVALRAFDRGKAWDQVERHGDLDGFVGGEDRAVVGQPLHRMRRADRAEARSTQRTIMSRIISPEMPAVVATQLMTSRAWQSR